MITKKQIKHIKSLQLKKFRQESKSFVVEGEKNVVSVLNSDWGVSLLIVTEKFENKYARLLDESGIPYELAKPDLLRSLGSYKSNDAALIVVDMPEFGSQYTFAKEDVVLVLDDIRDPGNLGTIIRIADWYGIKHLICSSQTAELYNPKVIASSMGSILNVDIQYAELPKFFEKQVKPIWGTFLEGDNIHAIDSKGVQGNAPIIVIGNESKGISAEVEQYIEKKITIPGSGSTESLNAGVATGIIVDNIFRLQF